MSDTPTRCSMLTAGLLTLVASTGCADSTSADRWEYDEPPPESQIDPSACTELPNDDLDKPAVSKTGDGRWKIRYPSFRQDCGAYQLDADIDFGAGEGDEAIYTHTFTACNRCESVQTWNYLPEVHGSSGLPNPDSEIEKRPVPKSPEVRSAPDVSSLGRPVVGHQTTLEERPVYEMCGRWNSRGKIWVDYHEVWQLGLEPGESMTTSVDLSADEAIPDLRDRLAASDDVTETTIQWPKLLHLEVDITGLEAASATEFCAEHAHDDRPRSWVRLYEEPYEVDAKYTKQMPPAPELPDELVERLRERAGNDNR